MPCSVIAVHPVDLNPVSYRLTFDDGTVIPACKDHRWLTYNAAELAALARRARRPSRSGSKKPEAFKETITAQNKANAEAARQAAPTGTVRTTQDIADTLLTPKGRRNHAIPVAKPLILPAADLPIDPYVLGAWLGDGNSRHASITCFDPQILAEIAAAGYRISRRATVGQRGICGLLLEQLRNLGLLANKHVPQAYLRASIEQRIALLQGLMDTDGNCTERGACEFTTTSPALRDGMAELLASLGIKAGGSEGRATLNGEDCGPKYRLKFTAPFPAFRLRRKAERQTFGKRRTTQFRYITKCERIDPVPMRCISVDSPSHLYLAGRQMVPTHNSDLLIGAAITQHDTSIIFRREYPQLKGLKDRAYEILNGKARYSGKDERWRMDNGWWMEFGAVQYEEDKNRFQGRPHSLKGFDEVTHLSRSQFEFLIGWNRSATPGQRSRVICAGNPPTNAEGDWVIDYWGPWLDPHHPNPAQPGELRWFSTVGGKDLEVRNGEPFVLIDDQIVYDFDPADFRPEQIITPKSRTFIPAKLADNPYYMASGYMATLQAMPEPLRSKMLNGDFGAGREDNDFQIIPTDWVLKAQARWRPERPGPIESIGVDVARGGNDKSVYTLRSGRWFDRQVVREGTATPDGWAVLQQIIEIIPADSNPSIQIDVIGVGASVYDLCVGARLNAEAMDARHATKARDQSGKLSFVNKRAEWWWSFREALDPLHGDDLALPPDRELLADLTTVRWMARVNGIQVEAKDDIIKRIGRSPDKGDSMVLAYARASAGLRTVMI